MHLHINIDGLNTMKAAELEVTVSKEKLHAIFITETKMQGCGVRVGTAVGVSLSRQFWLESELESAKIGRLRLWLRVTDYHLSSDDDFGRMVIHPSENTERWEEKESALFR